MPRRIGRYQVCGELGRGGMGIVYRAHDPELDRTVAIKVIHPAILRGKSPDDFVARFQLEMRATSAIFHPNLVSILDAGTEPFKEGTRVFYAMEFVDGPSLEERLVGGDPVPRPEALRIGLAIAQGLAVAHAAGLVHRDLKPSNILLPLTSPPKITDFGLCQTSGNDPLASSGAMLGSAHSISPEQIRRGEVDAGADLFALGTLLTRLLTGREPFAAGTLPAHLYRVLHDAPDGLDALEPSLRNLVLRLLDKSPENRPDATTVAEQLEQLLESDSSSPPLAPRARWTSVFPSRGFLAVAVLLLAGVLGGGAIVAHNELVALESQVDLQWQQVENQLARQHALLPQLLEVTDRYIAYENQALDRLLADSAPGSISPDLAARIDRSILELLVLGSRVPILRADEQFRNLAFEVAGTANRIAVERARYNETVGEFNRRIEQLPWRWLSGTRSHRAYFDPPDTELIPPVFGT